MTNELHHIYLFECVNCNAKIAVTSPCLQVNCPVCNRDISDVRTVNLSINGRWYVGELDEYQERDICVTQDGVEKRIANEPFDNDTACELIEGANLLELLFGVPEGEGDDGE